MRVLLADDQMKVRSALRLLLEQEPGLSVVGEAAEAEDLLAQVRTEYPDLVLLDWELPDQGGAATLAGLRAARPGPMVIALSGRPEARRAALAAGADAFVSKGDPPERLLAAVDDCWHRRHYCATGCQPVVSLTSARFRARVGKLW
jgi:DNA-binding NarL/FixJ family response regulator